MILLDDRAGSGELAKLFRCAVQIQRLIVGDMQFIDHDGSVIVVERKHVYELVNDFDRFVEQTRKADEIGFKQRILVLENNFSYLPMLGMVERGKRKLNSHSITYKQFVGRLFSVMEYWKVVQTNNPEETVLVVEELYSWCQKSKHSSFGRIDSGDVRNVPIVERMYRQLPGFGQIAKDLYNKFDSIEKLQTATDDEITSMSLIGKKKLHVIRQFIGGRNVKT